MLPSLLITHRWEQPSPLLQLLLVLEVYSKLRSRGLELSSQGEAAGCAFLGLPRCSVDAIEGPLHWVGCVLVSLDTSLHPGSALATAASCSHLNWLLFFVWTWEAMPVVVFCVWLAQKKNLSGLIKPLGLCEVCAQKMPSMLWIWGSKAALLQEKTADILTQVVEDGGFYKVLPTELHPCAMLSLRWHLILTCLSTQPSRVVSKEENGTFSWDWLSIEQVSGTAKLLLLLFGVVFKRFLLQRSWGKCDILCKR